MSLTGSRRTSGCLESRLGRSERGCRRRAAACGLGARRRGSSGGVRARGSGLGVARGRGAAKGGGCRGGAGLGWRLRGGVSSPAFQRGGGGVLRCGSEERARERGEWVSGVPLLLGRSLEESGGLCRGRSTATSRWRPSGRFWARRGAWHGKERASARQQEGEELRGDAWVTAHGELMAGKAGKALHGGGGRRCRRRERKQSRGVEVEEKGRFAITKSSRD